jgi:serine/threonine-protein phosphatase PGAM5
MTRTLLYLVRHGEQDPDSAGGELSDQGCQQAHQLGRRLRDVPFSEIHHSPVARAAQTADAIASYLPNVARHACDLMADRAPVPSQTHRDEYPQRFLSLLDNVPIEERDEDAAELQRAIEHFGTTSDQNRNELLITHNFVIGWFVRHVLDAPTWRWMGLNQANCGLTIVQWSTDRPPTLISFNDVGHLPSASA